MKFWAARCGGIGGNETKECVAPGRVKVQVKVQVKALSGGICECERGVRGVVGPGHDDGGAEPAGLALELESREGGGRQTEDQQNAPHPP